MMNITVDRLISTNECRFSRAAATILLLFASISFITNVHSLQNSQVTRRDRYFVLGMFISSLCVIVISVPSVVIQCFLCRRLSWRFICQIEGFNSFFNGCLAMYMLVTLSIVRYNTTANAPLSRHYQYRLAKKSVFLVFLCFVFSSIWAVPPLFGRISAYVPEGLGFHCGLNWFDRSLPTRIYFLFIFISVYCVPLIIIVVVNVYIQRTVHRLTHLYPNVTLELTHVSTEFIPRRHVSDFLYSKETRRLRCLHQDRRFVMATGISVLIYLIAWTPYSLVALTQVFGYHSSLDNQWLMTTCALLAKLSMITNPIIYTLLLKGRDMFDGDEPSILSE